MPELPEVETIRRTLAAKVVGRTIKHTEIALIRLIKWPSVPEFQALVTEKTIVAVERRGKYLLFRLRMQQHGQNELADSMLVVHLRMTGRLSYCTDSTVLEPHTHVSFFLDNGANLLYADTRTFGTLYVMPEHELWRISGLAKLGPEPLSQEFSLAYLQKILAGRKGNIKGLLLNQQLIGGLGNIYVDEALALAGVNPEKAAGTLTFQQTEQLHTAVNQVISDGIAHGGTTFRDYRDGDGQKGQHQQHLLVYGRTGQACRRCGETILKKTIAGRGTHYCPHCQQ